MAHRAQLAFARLPPPGPDGCHRGLFELTDPGFGSWIRAIRHPGPGSRGATTPGASQEHVMLGTVTVTIFGHCDNFLPGK